MLGLTVVMMVGEVLAGPAFGSVALLADGLHMGSHAAALGVALIAAKFAGAAWVDPAVGLLRALVVLYWSLGLARSTAGVLLDRRAGPRQLETIRAAIERAPGERLVGPHMWSIGPGLWAAELLVQTLGRETADDYRARLPAASGLVHVVVEVRTGVGAGDHCR